MKTYRTLTIPAQPEKIDLRAIELLCDLCKKPIKQFRPNGTITLNPLMVKRYGDAVEVLVQLRAGERNLNGGLGETTSFDICPRCFEERLQPWLEGQGAEANVDPWSS